MDTAVFCFFLTRLESNHNPGAQPQIVLPVVNSIFKARHKIIRFHRANREVPVERNFQPAARDHRESVGRTINQDITRRQTPARMRPAYQHLRERRDSSPHLEAITRPGHKRRQRQVRARSFYIGSPLSANQPNHRNVPREVKRQPAVATLQINAPASSRRRISPHVIVINTHIDPAAVLRLRASANSRPAVTVIPSTAANPMPRDIFIRPRRPFITAPPM